MQEAEADEDYTVYADRTVYTEQGRTTGPGGYTEQGGYTGSGSYTEQRGYTGPVVIRSRKDTQVPAVIQGRIGIQIRGLHRIFRKMTAGTRRITIRAEKNS